MRVLVLFDFDGTLSRKDSFIPFLQFVTGPVGMTFRLICLFPAIAVYFMALRDNHWLKNQFISTFLKGRTEDELHELGKIFYCEKMQKILRAEAIQSLKKHLSSGHECVVVSASAEYWLRPFCEQFGIKLICSRWEIKDGKIAGKLLGRNNYGAEKARRIREEYILSEYDLIVAYGDSKGDLEMMALAKRRHYREFRLTAEDGIKIP
jgi:HAD superfamily hydrolase (TIGR01490 family)